jgi:hypothetical protein
MSTDTKNIFTKSFGSRGKRAVDQTVTQEQLGQLKEENPATFDSENIVEAIHREREQVQRITVDMPKDIYKKMKVYLANEEVSIRDFVVRLVDVYLTKNAVK